jgi:hypothetical protein
VYAQKKLLAKEVISNEQMIETPTREVGNIGEHY